MAENPNTPDEHASVPHSPSPEFSATTPFPAQDSRLDTRPSISLRDSDQPSWTGLDVLALALLMLVFMFVLSLAGFGIAMHVKAFRGIPFAELARDPRVVIPVQALAYLCVFFCMLWIVGHRRTDSFWRAIHWNWPTSNIYGLFLGGLVLALAIQFSSALLPIPKQLPIEKFFKNTLGAYLMAVFGTTIAPLMEELFFRGFLYPVLARRAGVTLGVVVTSLLFAFIHQSQLGYAWAPLLLLFIVGLVLTWVRARTGSVARSFVIHVGYNTTLFALLWVQTDHFHNMQRAAAAMFTLK